jgi:hypothetical protein
MRPGRLPALARPQNELREVPPVNACIECKQPVGAQDRMHPDQEIGHDSPRSAGPRSLPAAGMRLESGAGFTAEAAVNIEIHIDARCGQKAVHKLGARGGIRNQFRVDERADQQLALETRRLHKFKRLVGQGAPRPQRRNYICINRGAHVAFAFRAQRVCEPVRSGSVPGCRRPTR